MPSPAPPQDLSRLSLEEIERLVRAKKLPPVERWNPSHCGHSAMRIARDGTWFHEGKPIERAAMVRLFSTILRREPDGRFVLVTPAEKLDIEVEETPFLAVEVKSEGEGPERILAFRLNTGEMIVAGADRPIRIEDRPEGPHPLLSVRPGLDALLARSVYYELAEMALTEGGDPPGLYSHGAFFSFEAAP